MQKQAREIQKSSRLVKKDTHKIHVCFFLTVLCGKKGNFCRLITLLTPFSSPEFLIELCVAVTAILVDTSDYTSLFVNRSRLTPL